MLLSAISCTSALHHHTACTCVVLLRGTRVKLLIEEGSISSDPAAPLTHRRAGGIPWPFSSARATTRRLNTIIGLAHPSYAAAPSQRAFTAQHVLSETNPRSTASVEAPSREDASQDHGPAGLLLPCRCFADSITRQSRGRHRKAQIGIACMHLSRVLSKLLVRAHAVASVTP